MKRCMAILLIFGLLIGLAGCDSEETEARAELEARLAELEAENAKLKATEEKEIDEQVAEKSSEANEIQEQREVVEETSSSTEKVLDAFINNEIPLSGEEACYFKDMMQVEGSQLGERVDLDNDEENELIITDIYGANYLDVRDDKVWIFAQGLGTAGMLDYIEYDGAIWIYHSDTSHLGRQTYEFEKYEGGDKLVDSFDLKDEYWDDVNHVYTYRGKEISKQEYDEIFGEIFGTDNTEVVEDYDPSKGDDYYLEKQGLKSEENVSDFDKLFYEKNGRYPDESTIQKRIVANETIIEKYNLQELEKSLLETAEEYCEHPVLTAANDYGGYLSLNMSNPFFKAVYGDEPEYIEWVVIVHVDGRYKVVFAPTFDFKKGFDQ